METGKIVEFSTNGGYRLGVITGELGKKKLIVVTEGGDEMRPGRDDITFEVGKSAATEPDRATAALAGFRDEVEGLTGDVDLEMLWEFVREIGEPHSAAQMAELMFSSDEPAAVLAMLHVLRDDIVYFKQKREVFEPRPPSQVEALREQREAERRKELERENFIAAVDAILNSTTEDRNQITSGHMEDPTFRTFTQLLQDYAVFGEEFDRRRQADELLDELAEAVGGKLKGGAHFRAFHLLIDLGIWNEHENLWLHRFRISPEPGPALVEEARLRAAQPWEPEPWRRDLTRVFCFTIDDAHTRDIDDALSCEPLLEGGWKIGVHIADPSARVQLDCALDHDARSRGTSIYLPTGHIPMFPKDLSEGAMSLVAGEVRPAISTEVVFDANLDIVSSEVYPSVVRVDQRLTYDEVDHLLFSSENSMLADMLQSLSFVGDECMNRRVDAGAASIDLPEVKLLVDLSGHEPQITCEPVDNVSAARLLVSEMMILGNQIMAEFCHRNDIPTIYRGQVSPDGELIDDEIMALPEGLAREFGILRRMKRGDITTEPVPHFGLGLDKYVQASSPIRRYSDLVCQRQIKAFLAGEPLPFDAESILGVLASVEHASREAGRAERETTRYWLTYYLGNRRGEALDAVVVEHKDGEGLRTAVFIKECAYKVNCNFRRPVPLGSTVKVAVDRADPRRDILVLKEA